MKRLSDDVCFPQPSQTVGCSDRKTKAYIVGRKRAAFWQEASDVPTVCAARTGCVPSGNVNGNLQRLVDQHVACCLWVIAEDAGQQQRGKK